MSDYEPTNLEADAAHLKNELMEVGQLASILLSRAAVERGNNDPVVEMYDKVAQRLTGTILEFELARGELTDAV